MIRDAWTHPVLWRNDRAKRKARLPFLVLPLAYGRLAVLHINVLLTLELTNAGAV